VLHIISEASEFIEAGLRFVPRDDWLSRSSFLSVPWGGGETESIELDSNPRSQRSSERRQFMF
jgi:hypothetical protein